MEHKYMTLDEIVELSRELDRRYERFRAANLPEDEEKREGKEITELMIEMSVQLACYMNNEIIGKLVVTNKSIPAIAGAARFVSDSLQNLNKKDDPARMACIAIPMMLGHRLGCRSVSIDMNALRNNNAD